MHAGHELLLRSAFENADAVYIGLTSDEMAHSQRKIVRTFASRRRSLISYCSKLLKPFFISKLHDPFGPAVERASLSAIAVTLDTSFRVSVINRLRLKKGMQPLKSIIVPIVRCADGVQLSSSRVLSGECDREGNVLRKIKIGIGSTNPSKVDGVKSAFGRYGRDFSRPVFRPVDVKTAVGEQPSGDETIKGAMNRAKAALRDNDMGIGIEAGLFRNRLLRSTFDIQYCIIIDRAGYVSSGHGMGFSYPPQVLKRVNSGETVGTAMSSVSGISDIGRKGGAIGYLSGGMVTRAELTEQAVVAALIPRINRVLYASL